jgi:hypothetical protein
MRDEKLRHACFFHGTRKAAAKATARKRSGILRVLARAGTVTSFAFCLLLVPGFGQQVSGQQTRRITSPGSAPFTESLQDMIQRDQQRRTAPQGEYPRIIEAPSEEILGLERKAPLENTFPRVILPPTLDAPQTIGQTFQTINLQDQFLAFGSGSLPPDTMGAVGPSHFLEIINSSVAVF